MKAFVGILAVWFAVGPAMVIHAVTEAPDFERYQVILTRLPFGAELAPPSGPASDAPPVPPSESFAKNIKVCAMTRHQLTGKLQVGLVDTGTRKNYFLQVGDEEDGISLVQADYDGERALLRKGTEELWIKLTDGGGVAVASPVSRQGGIAPPPGLQPAVRPPTPIRGATPLPGVLPPGGTAAMSAPQPGRTASAHERLAALQARRAEVAAAGGATVVPQAGGSTLVPQAGGATVVPQVGGATVVPQVGGSTATSMGRGAVQVSANVVTITDNNGVTTVSSEVTPQNAAEKEKAEVLEARRRLIQKNVLSTPNASLSQNLQNYQMDLIRAQGRKGPPLPIQLTPEADAQLVAEGVLPPQE